MTFDQFISDCSAALQTEINYLKTQGGTKHKITEGKLLRRHTGYTYLFTLSTEITLPDGSPIRVSFGKRTANGEVVSLDGFDVVLELDADLGEAIEEADLYSEPWKLLEELQVRLAEMIHSGETKLAKWVLTGKAPNRVETPSKNRLNEIIKRSRKNRTTYIWGPPGTGKTYTLSHISVYNLMKGTSILVLSHSNAAVDNIMIRIADILEKEKNAWKPGQVVRFGVPKVKEGLEHDTLLASRLVEHDNPDLKTKNSTLARQVSSLKEKVKRRNSALAKEELAKKEPFL